MRHEYRLNTTNEMRRYRVIEPNGLIYSDYYPAGTLQVHCTWQDNLPETIRKYEYTDAQGQKVAVRVQTASVDEFTCNVYDEFGRMRYTVPAIIGDSLSIDKIYRPEELTHYAFYYEYDRYGRQTKAWIPGAEPICQLYDNQGRVVMKQTGNQRTGGKNEWTFIKYDVSGRQIMTGIYIGGNEERHAAALRSQIDLGETRGSAIHGYTNDCYPPVASENDVLSISYYDNYDWIPTTSACVFLQADRLDSNYSSQIIGLSTGSKSKVLGIDGDRWLTSALYYDDEYRMIQSVTELYPGGVEIVSNKHDFIGNVVQTKVKQTIGSQSYEYNKWFDYDTSGRLVAVRQKITNDQLNGEVTVASYTYDDLGRTEETLIHNGVQTDSHTYRLSGTLVGTTSPSFSYSLGFDRPVAGQSARYDGQIADMAWGCGVDMTQGYRYTYDAKGQMTGAMHAERDVDSWEKKATFNEDGITYDKNGNILTMHRSDVDGRELHDLVYHYDGNRLHSVTRNSEDSEVYTYDADGNMTYDGMRGVGIEYNELNLPKRIFAGADEIRYIYSSNGTKLASVANGSFTYYRSVMVYGKGTASEDEALLYMLQPEGLVTHNGSGEWTYKYFKKDHLGNTRVVLSATQTPSGIELTPEQTTDYYAYGLAWSYNDLHRNRYLYNGKELQDAAIGNLGLLGLYDFGARYYDPMLGRWFNIDPALQLVNPYLYCGNSPMMYVDENGEFFFSLFLGPFGAVIDAACWGAVIGMGSYTISVALSPGGFNNWNWGQFGRAAGFGALSGAATYGIGQIFGTPGTIWNEIGRGLAHGAMQGGMSELQGGNFLSGFAAGGLGSLAGSAWQSSSIGYDRAGMYAVSAFTGGFGSAAAGGSFLQGATTGIMITGLNHLQSSIMINGGKAGYRFMENEQKRLGVEISGYELENGKILISPTGKNARSVSRSKVLLRKDGERSVEYRNVKYNVNTHVHTHLYNRGDIGISDADRALAKTYNRPIKILYNSGVYLLNSKEVLTGPIMTY